MISSFGSGVTHREGSSKYNSATTTPQNRGEVEIIGKGKIYPAVPYRHLGSFYKFPTLVLNVGGFTIGNEIANPLGNKYGGALCLDIPDGTVKGGIPRGHSSIDLQSARQYYYQVASGDYSVVLGSFNRATSTSSVAIGCRNSSTGSYALALGYTSSSAGAYSLALGYVSSSQGSYSTAIGYYNISSGSNSATFGTQNDSTHALTTVLGSYGKSRGSCTTMIGARGVTTNKGATQKAFVHFACQTTDGTTAKRATTDNATANSLNQYVFGITSVIEVTYKAIGITSSTEVTVIEGKFCMKKGSTASTTALVGTHTSSKIYGDSALDGATITVTADTTLGTPKVEVKGVASKTIKWNISMNIEETGF